MMFSQLHLVKLQRVKTVAAAFRQQPLRVYTNYTQVFPDRCLFFFVIFSGSFVLVLFLASFQDACDLDPNDVWQKSSQGHWTAEATQRLQETAGVCSANHLTVSSGPSSYKPHKRNTVSDIERLQNGPTRARPRDCCTSSRYAARKY
jgi:hypothetical protein